MTGFAASATLSSVVTVTFDNAAGAVDSLVSETARPLAVQTGTAPSSAFRGARRS